jgi:hypothetical protein
MLGMFRTAPQAFYFTYTSVYIEFGYGFIYVIDIEVGELEI